MMNKAFLNNEENVTMYMANYLLSMNNTTVEEHCAVEMRKLKSELEQYKEHAEKQKQEIDLLNRRMEALTRANGLKPISVPPMISIPLTSRMTSNLDPSPTSSSCQSAATKPEPFTPNAVITSQNSKSYQKLSINLSEDSEDDESEDKVSSLLQPTLLQEELQYRSNDETAEEILTVMREHQTGHVMDDTTPIAMELGESFYASETVQDAPKSVTPPEEINNNSAHSFPEMSKMKQEEIIEDEQEVVSSIEPGEQSHAESITVSEPENSQVNKKEDALPVEINFNEAQLSAPLKVIIPAPVEPEEVQYEASSQEEMVIDEEPALESLKSQTSKQIEDAVKSLGATVFEPDEFEESLHDFIENFTDTEAEVDKTAVNSTTNQTSDLDPIECQMLALETPPPREESASGSDVFSPEATVSEKAETKPDPVIVIIDLNADEFVPDYEDDDL